MMNSKIFYLFLFLIVTLGTYMFFSFNQYKYIEGMTINTINFTSETGASATLATDYNGEDIITFTDANGKETIYTYSDEMTNVDNEDIQSSVFTNNKGGKAVLITGSDGMYMLKIFDNSENLVVSLISDTITGSVNSNSNNSNSRKSLSNYNYDNYNHYSKTSYPTVFYGANGGTARIIQTGTDSTVVITNKNGSTEIYYIKNTAKARARHNMKPTMNIYYGPNGSSAKIITDENGKHKIVISDINGQLRHYKEDNVLYSQDTSFNTESPDPVMWSESKLSPVKMGFDYSKSLPPGIPKSMIPRGQEDLYILKSEVVPPVCPVCPECPTNNSKKVPPCPPCARCPEPAFDCKKVPNYSAFNPEKMPVPVLGNYNGFGM